MKPKIEEIKVNVDELNKLHHYQIPKVKPGS